MSGFIEGENRYQATLFPEKLDDFVSEDNPVRVIDVFVDKLDISGLGFKIESDGAGRPGYHPSTMLKLYVYGYLNRVQSSRRLERETQRNLELMWLTGRLTPDFKTIADFRKDNGAAIQLVCKRFVELCRALDLLTNDAIAVDGSKFKAVNNRDNNFTKAKMQRRLDEIDQSIARYLAQIASADLQETKASQAKSRNLKEKIEKLTEEIERLKLIEIQLNEAPDNQISLTDPDARSMKARGTGIVGYNVQTAVDVENHIIVAHEVTNKGSDRSQLHNISSQAQQVLNSDSLDVVADRGYFNLLEIEACYADGIFPTMPAPQTSPSLAKGRYPKRDFKYIEEDDEYECPAGERLEWRMRTEEKGLEVDKYWTDACEHCPVKSACTTGDSRRVSRWQSEELVEDMLVRLDTEPDRMKKRRQTVEHPFGTIKLWMGYTHFQMRRLENVSTEMSLHVLAYNMKRVINLLGVTALVEAIMACMAFFVPNIDDLCCYVNE